VSLNATAIQRVRVARGDGIDAAVAQELGGLFHVDRLERRGPVSRVYLAREVEGDRVVALKVLPRSPGTRGGAGAADRFEAAVAVAATLDHAHVIPVFRCGATPRLFWYTMKRVEGGSLDELLRRAGPLELQPCLRLVEQVAAGLHYAHRRGVTHGNVKPANVMVGADDWALLGDFAIARALDAGDRSGADDEGGTSRLARYLAPEEHATRQPGPAADQYALAVLVGECLLGPAASDALPHLVDARPEVPERVWQALTRATSRDPAARFSTVLDLVAVLQGDPAGPLPLPPPAAPRLDARGAPGGGAGSPPPVLLDDDYEPAVPPSRAARLMRRVALGAGGAVLCAAVAVSGIALRERGTGGHSRQVVASESWQSVDPEAATPVVALRDSARVTVSPRRPLPRPATVAARRPPRLLAPGRLFVSATPWGALYVDGRPMGNTPKAGLAIAAGWHRVRVVHDGFEPFEQTIQVPAGQDVRLASIALRELRR